MIECKCGQINQVKENDENGTFDVKSSLVKDRILFLTDDVEIGVATELVATLLYLDLKNSSKEITIYINSQGGDAQNGLMTIYDAMQFITSPIKTICIGEAYSTAAVLLAAGTKGLRFAAPHAKIMIHSLQLGNLSGTQQEIEDETKQCKKLNDTVMKIIANHTGQHIKKVKRDCLKDKYFTAEEAIKYGLIDGIMQSNKKF